MNAQVGILVRCIRIRKFSPPQVSRPLPSIVMALLAHIILSSQLDIALKSAVMRWAELMDIWDDAQLEHNDWLHEPNTVVPCSGKWTTDVGEHVIKLALIECSMSGNGYCVLVRDTMQPTGHFLSHCNKGGFFVFCFQVTRTLSSQPCLLLSCVFTLRLKTQPHNRYAFP